MAVVKAEVRQKTGIVIFAILLDEGTLVRGMVDLATFRLRFLGAPSQHVSISIRTMLPRVAGLCMKQERIGSKKRYEKESGVEWP